METKVNYVIVGLFALLLSVALIAGVLWLSASKQYSLAYDTYLTYMDESVSGLNLNAPVKYRGVAVGQVKQISLEKSNLEQVRLELAVEHGLPIKADTIATLKSQGLTGIAYIELSGGSSQSAVLVASSSPPYPVIKAGTSLLGRLDTALNSLLTRLNRTLENMNALMDAENQKALKHTLKNVAVLTDTLVARKAELDKAVSNASLTLENVAQISTQFSALIERASKTTAAVEKMAVETSRASVSVRKTFDAIGPDAKRFSSEGLPELEKLMVAMRELTVTMQRTTEQIERDPSILLRGTETRQPGPGE